MTNLIVRSGVHTIGGTVIELINGEDRLVFDFGTVFDPASSDEVNPKVEGIYDGTSKYNDHVLISHLHLDHIKAMNLIPNKVPIHMHEDGIKFLSDLKQIGFNQIKGEYRDYTAIGDVATIGGFTVSSCLVDHDVPGAVGYIFENEDITLVYTGDIRLHGMHRERTIDFIKLCQSKNVDVLISEGVTISFIDDNYEIIPTDVVKETEFEFGHRLETIIDKSKTQFFNSYIMGIERLQTMISLATRLNKSIALTPESALIAKSWLSEDNLFVIEEDKYNSGYQVINLDSIDGNWVVDFDYQNKDVYMPVMEGNELIQTGGEPLGDYDPRFNLFKEELEVNNCKFIVEGLGGHASPENLQFICNSIKPKYTFPLHSFKPQLLTAKDSIQIVAEEDKVYTFEKHDLHDSID